MPRRNRSTWGQPRQLDLAECLDDPLAVAELASQFSKESTGTIAAPSATEGEKMWNALVTTYVELIARCGQLIRG